MHSCRWGWPSGAGHAGDAHAEAERPAAAPLLAAGCSSDSPSPPNDQRRSAPAPCAVQHVISVCGCVMLHPVAQNVVTAATGWPSGPSGTSRRYDTVSSVPISCVPKLRPRTTTDCPPAVSARFAPGTDDPSSSVSGKKVTIGGWYEMPAARMFESWPSMRVKTLWLRPVPGEVKQVTCASATVTLQRTPR